MMMLSALTDIWTYLSSLSLEDWRNLVLSIGAPLALILAVWRARVASRQTNLAEQAANMDRFQKGSQMLGDDRLSVRQAGVIILHDLAKSQIAKFPKRKEGLALMCAEVLEKFVIDRGNEKGEVNTEEANGEDKPHSITPDAQSALTNLIQIRNKLGSDVELAGANLSEAELNRANLKKAKLMGAKLMGANLNRANLNEGELNGANLNGAELMGAELMGVELNRASLSRANLMRAKLNGAKLMGANLNRANLMRADLMRADLSEAIFPDDMAKQIEQFDSPALNFTDCWAYKDTPPKNLPAELVKLVPRPDEVIEA